jgi:hypothetical protein
MRRKLDEDISAVRDARVKGEDVPEAVFNAREKGKSLPGSKDVIPGQRVNARLGDSLIVVFDAHDVVLAQVIAKLNFDDCQTDVAAVSQAMIGFGRDVDVLTLLQLQFTIATDNVSHAFNHDPVFAAPRVSLQAQSRAGFHFQHLDLKAGSFFQDFVTAPGSLVKLSHQHYFLGRGCR